MGGVFWFMASGDRKRSDELIAVLACIFLAGWGAIYVFVAYDLYFR